MVKFYVSFILPFLLAVTFLVFVQDGRTTLNELKVTGVWSKNDYDGNSDYRFKFNVNRGDWIGYCISKTAPNQFWIMKDEELPKHLVDLANDEI